MAAAPIPRSHEFEVRQGHPDVRPDAGHGHRAARDIGVEQVRGRDRDLVPHPSLLVGPVPEHAIEDIHRDRHQVGMGDPRPVEPVTRLADLVVADACERAVRHLGIAPVRDERGHPADRVGAAPVTRPDEQLRVRAHERDGHRQLRAVR